MFKCYSRLILYLPGIIKKRFFICGIVIMVSLLKFFLKIRALLILKYVMQDMDEESFIDMTLPIKIPEGTKYIRIYSDSRHSTYYTVPISILSLWKCFNNPCLKGGYKMEWTFTL